MVVASNPRHPAHYHSTIAGNSLLFTTYSLHGHYKHYRTLQTELSYRMRCIYSIISSYRGLYMRGGKVRNSTITLNFKYYGVLMSSWNITEGNTDSMRIF